MKYDFSALQKSKLTGKPVLHFAHANGIPSKVYQPLFEIFSQYFTIEYIPLLGATEGYSIDDHWNDLTNQIIDSVSQACVRHSITAVTTLGHSLGALCSLQAIYRNPELFEQAVLFDPPCIYGQKSFIWHIAKQLDKSRLNLKLMDKLSPAGISKNRRDTWDSRDQARKSLEDKKFFRNFDKRCFEGYIQHGLKETSNKQVTLTIPKMNEVMIFRTNPSWYWLKPNKAPKCPVRILVGEDSMFFEQKFPHKIKKRLNIPFSTHVGGHMFPLEHPDSVVMTTLSIYEQQSKMQSSLNLEQDK